MADGLFDFKGLGSMLAMGFGVGDVMHLDGGDSESTLAIIFSCGTGVVYFCIPQLEMKIPLHPHQGLAVSTRLLSHYAYVIEGTGSRSVFTFFTDSGTVSHAVP